MLTGVIPAALGIHPGTPQVIRAALLGQRTPRDTPWQESFEDGEHHLTVAWPAPQRDEALTVTAEGLAPRDRQVIFTLGNALKRAADPAGAVLTGRDCQMHTEYLLEEHDQAAQELQNGARTDVDFNFTRETLSHLQHLIREQESAPRTLSGPVHPDAQAIMDRITALDAFLAPARTQAATWDLYTDDTTFWPIWTAAVLPSATEQDTKDFQEIIDEVAQMDRMMGLNPAPVAVFDQASRADRAAYRAFILRRMTGARLINVILRDMNAYADTRR